MFRRSRHAAPVAVALAEACPAEIDVLNAVRLDRIDHPDQIRNVQQHFYKALDSIVPLEAKQFCESRTFVSVGDAQSQILKHIEDREIDLLILGLRRNTHLGTQNRTSGVLPIIVEALNLRHPRSSLDSSRPIADSSWR